MSIIRRLWLFIFIFPTANVSGFADESSTSAATMPVTTTSYENQALLRNDGMDKTLRQSEGVQTAALRHGASPAGFDDEIAVLEHEWKDAAYHIPKGQRLGTFKELAAKAHRFALANPDKAEPMVWEAIILCDYAEEIHGFESLQKVEMARERLLLAEKIKPDALNGMIFALLGELYYKVPEWPVSFGNKGKAREYLDKSIRYDPEGIRPNYLYGDFLIRQKEYAKASAYLEKALNAPPKPGRQETEQELRADAQKLLEKLKQHNIAP